MRKWLALAVLVQSALAGTATDVSFTEISPLSANLEIARRMLTPLTAARIPAELSRSGKTLDGQPIDPAKEQFLLYVPDRAPPQGYGLMVFVPPWQDARLPDGWAPVLDRHGMIFVSAAHSGNVESVLGRRVPLALLAEQNVALRYRLDPERIIIAGFSGGARVAMSIALAYPDVFRGALLNAGSDPIATLEVPLPPRELFARFQSSRLVYVSGENDAGALATDTASTRAMRRWCVFGLISQVTPRTGHAVAEPVEFARALGKLDAPFGQDEERLADCRAQIERKLSDELGHVRSLIARDPPAARRALDELDMKYGGLAAPASLEIAGRIAPD